MYSPTLNPFTLVSQALPIVPKVYVPLLILSSPTIALSLVGQIIPILESPLSLAYSISVAPLLTAASLLLIDRHVKGELLDAATALQLAIAKFSELFSSSLFILLVVFLGTLALIIPGIYIGVALIFVINALVLSESSRLSAAPPIPLLDGLAKAVARDALGAVRHSWRLVTPHWLAVFAAHLGLGLCLLVPLIVGVIPITAISLATGSDALATILGAVLIALLIPIYLVWDYRLFRSLEQM